LIVTEKGAVLWPSENVTVAEDGNEEFGELKLTEPTFPLTTTKTRVSLDVPKYVPLPPARETFNT
jgi:hypothetical protein